MVPEIHGKGRIIFRSLILTELPIHKIKLIPDGPAVDQAFIQEGIEILRRYPEHDLPYITIVHDLDDAGTHWGEYWVIDGRHRFTAYREVRPTIWLPALLGYGMKVLEK